eukprot:364828-Chlamydomonas_euryale.AAC.3
MGRKGVRDVAQADKTGTAEKEHLDNTVKKRQGGQAQRMTHICVPVRAEVTVDSQKEESPSDIVFQQAPQIREVSVCNDDG